MAAWRDCRSTRATPLSATRAPDYDLARSLVAELPVPVLISGGLHHAEQARHAFEQTGAEGLLLARGSLGNPWLFGELLGLREGEPEPDEILAELDWVLACAREHLGEDRAARYLRQVLSLVRRAAGAAASPRQVAAGRGSDRADARGRPGAVRGGSPAADRAEAPWRKPPADGNLQSELRACLYSSAHGTRTLRDPPLHRRVFFVKNASSTGHTQCPRTSSSHQKDYRTSSPSSIISRPPDVARLRRGSRRPESSGTSPRTPSTTTPRTSRRCSRRGSPS